MTEMPFSPLAADLMTASLTATARATDQVIDALQEDNAQLRATIAAIREGVHVALDGPYMPTPTAIASALYPSQAVIAAYREAGTP